MPRVARNSDRYYSIWATIQPKLAPGMWALGGKPFLSQPAGCKQLFGSEGDHRVYTGGSAGGQIARDQCHDRQHYGYGE